MKFRTPELFLGAFLASAIFAMGMLFTSYYSSPSAKDQRQQTEPAAQNSRASISVATEHAADSQTTQRNEEKSEFWTAKLTDWLLALFTFFLVFFNYRLWKSTEKLWSSGEKQIGIGKQMADVAEKQLAIIALQTDIQKKQHAVGRLQFIATHRPRVILRYIQGPFYNDEGHQYIWLTFANIGANDAIIDAFGGDLAYRGGFNEAWQIPGLDADLKDVQPITLACGQRHFFTVTAKTSLKTAEFISKSAWPGFQICAVGILRYRDGNGISRHTGFFRVLDDEGMRFVVSEHESEMEYQD